MSRRLFKTARLCDFYNYFVDVVSEWRSKENGQDLRCTQGEPAMVVNDVKLLSHAKKIYTVEIYFLFEEQYMKSFAFDQILLGSDDISLKYHVWREDLDIIQHEVLFNVVNICISCTCKMFFEVCENL